MTELYKVLFTYETDKEDELHIEEGETIRVTKKDSAEWWLAEKMNSKEYGLVPSNYIEKIHTSPGIKLAIVTQDYISENPGELTLQKDRVVTILEQNEGWWKGDLNGKTGIFPSNYVELIKDNEHPGDDQIKKDPFKLAAYGVKKGGIGSILAGGFSLKRTSNRTSINETPSNNNAVPPISPVKHTVPVTPKKPTYEKDKITKKAMVIHDHSPENEDEIKLMRGEYVTITDMLENDGWWKGTNERGLSGVFPSSYVQIVEDETPIRPSRTRPATVKAEVNTPSDQTNKLGPPPVPLNTRPSSLLTQRDPEQQSPLSPSPSHPPRPLTTPPARPITSPPIPTRRTNSIIAPSHQRTPSIPSVPLPPRPTVPHPPSTTEVPILPTRPILSRPPSTQEAPIPPTRPVTGHGITHTESSASPVKPIVSRPPSNLDGPTPPTRPLVSRPPSNLEGPSPPTRPLVSRPPSVQETPTPPTRPLFPHPPSVQETPTPPTRPLVSRPPSVQETPTPPTRPIVSRPPSVQETIAPPTRPPIPRPSSNIERPIPPTKPLISRPSSNQETMPTRPLVSHPPSIQEEPTAPTRPLVPHPPSNLEGSTLTRALDPPQQEIPTPPKRSMPLPPKTALPIDPKIQQWIESEANKIRQEFEIKFESERNERLRIQLELEELKKSLLE